jgi:hypothetical protein
VQQRKVTPLHTDTFMANLGQDSGSAAACDYTAHTGTSWVIEGVNGVIWTASMQTAVNADSRHPRPSKHQH